MATTETPVMVEPSPQHSELLLPRKPSTPSIGTLLGVSPPAQQHDINLENTTRLRHFGVRYSPTPVQLDLAPPLTDVEEALTITRDTVAHSALRSRFTEQRDQLLAKFGTKLDHVRRRYDTLVKPLVAIAYQQWGATEPVALPEQCAKRLDISQVMAHVLPHIATSSVQAHAQAYFDLFTTNPQCLALIQDMFWFFFLEYFCLSETNTRFDRYRMEQLELLKLDEPRSQRTRGKRDYINNTNAALADSVSSSVGSGAKSAASQRLRGAAAQQQQHSPRLPVINSSHPLWRKRLHDYSARDGGPVGQKPPPGPPKSIEDLLAGEDDGDDNVDDEAIMFPGDEEALVARGTTTQQQQSGDTASSSKRNNVDPQERRKRDFVKRLRRRHLLSMPSHVLGNHEAYNLRHAAMPSAAAATVGHDRRIETSNTKSSSRSRLRSAPTSGSQSDARATPATAIRGGEDDDEVASLYLSGCESASCYSVASMPTSDISRSSSRTDDDDANLVDSAPSYLAPVASRSSSSSARRGRQYASVQQILDDAARIRQTREVRGEKNFLQALAVLVEAEEVELTHREWRRLERHVTERTPEGVAEAQATVDLACHLVAREHHRMFGRMSRNFVEMTQHLAAPLRNALLPSMPDIVGRVVVQLLYQAVPYARELLTRRVKKTIKKRVAYWMSGLESSNIEDWVDTVGVTIEEDEIEVYRGRFLQHASGGHNATRKQSLASGQTISSSVSESLGVATSQTTPQNTEALSLSQSARTFGRGTVGFLPLGSNGDLALPGTFTVGDGARRRSSAASSPRSPARTSSSPRGRGTRVGFGIATSRRTGVAIQPLRPSTDNEATASVVPPNLGADAPLGGSLARESSSFYHGSPSSAAGAADLSWSIGAVAYHRALDEILTDFDRILTANGTEGGAATLRPPVSSTAAGGMATKQPHRRSRHRGKANAAAEESKPLETHRHAPANRRADLWHEQGRSSQAAVNAFTKSRQGYFDLTNRTPFMQRYLKDKGVQRRTEQALVTRLIRWTA